MFIIHYNLLCVIIRIIEVSSVFPVHFFPCVPLNCAPFIHLSNRYCEVISHTVEKNPTAYRVEFLSQVHELACRLKYHDLHYQMYQGEMSEIPDPQWLSNLRDVVDSARHREHQQMMELQGAAGTDVHSYMYRQDQGTESLTQTVAADPSYTMANTTQNHVPHMDPHNMSYGAPESHSYQQVDPAYTTQPSPDVLDNSQYTSSPHSPSKGADASSMNSTHPQGVMGLPQVSKILALSFRVFPLLLWQSFLLFHSFMWLGVQWLSLYIVLSVASGRT